MSEEILSTEYIKHTFTEEEIKEISTEMARAVSDLTQLEEDKKAVVSDFKSRIDTLAARVSQSARWINDGFKFKDIKCRVEKDYNKGMIYYYRTDTGELAKERVMRPDEYQADMNYGEDGKSTFQACKECKIVTDGELTDGLCSKCYKGDPAGD